MRTIEEYRKFLETKKTTIPESGFDVGDSNMNPHLFPFQRHCVRRALKCGKYALFENTGLGKEQPYTEPVLTPNGFVNMGDLKIGDYVIARSGRPTKITGIFEQGEKDVYSVKFSDGTSTRCGLEHLWNVRNRNEANSGKPFRTVALKDILHCYKKRVSDKRYPNAERWDYRYQIPVCGSVYFNSIAELKLHPYLMGVILGDGCISQHSVRICKPNDRIKKLVESYKPEGDIVTDYMQDGMSYTIKNPISNKPSKTKEILSGLGLMGLKSKEKFIPQEYLFASEADRRLLLDGLIDTDGHRIGETLFEYSTASNQLCEDIAFLARSLGYIVRVSERESRYKADGEKFKNYRIYIYLYSARKLKTIHDIQLVGREKSRCIMVDDPDHCYLTKDFIVTHNTIQQLEWGGADSETHRR